MVTDENKNLVWDSGKTESDVSLGIAYQGQELKARTRYSYTITVWDQNGERHQGSSWFETGLMNTDKDATVWNGAQWIGGGIEDIPFYSHYLSVFKLAYQLQLDAASNSTKASLVFGGNDTRLLQKDLNIQGVVNKKDESYIRMELDISQLSTSEGKAFINIYRVGYAPDDSNEEPLLQFPIASELVNNDNKYEPHTIYVHCNFGLFDIFVNGSEEPNRVSYSDLENPSRFDGNSFNLNPVGRGHNFISFPMLADIGFYADANQQAKFSSVEVRNFRAPSNVLWQLKNSAFMGEGDSLEISGGASGTLLLTDPSKNSEPMLRSTFSTENKTIKKARLYATARGIYEFYINGGRVGDNYFSPGLTQYNKSHMYQTYDVTDMVQQGENALGSWLSEGWWSGNITYSGENWNFFGDRQSLKAQLIITYEDGSEQIVTYQ